MATRIIACEMLRPEVEFVLKEQSITFDVTWIEPALHLTPKKLHRRLQEVLDSFTDCERVLMPFGDCGGALEGLRTGGFETIIPIVDDCLTLMLGSLDIRQQIMKEAPTFFLTLGWLEQDHSIFATHEYAVKKYGKENAQMLNKEMYGSYKRVALIDTGIGNYDELLAYEKPLKEIFGFEKHLVQGTVGYLRQLFSKKLTPLRQFN